MRSSFLTCSFDDEGGRGEKGGRKKKKKKKKRKEKKPRGGGYKLRMNDDGREGRLGRTAV